MLLNDASHSRRTQLSGMVDTPHLNTFKMEEDSRANEFIDYQNPYMFLEFPPKPAREQYDDHKALYPGLDELEEGITRKIELNKRLKGLKLKIWFQDMDKKLADRISPQKET
uniref:Uncharacterized protein n=1 Tax=Euplotes crassus TaxID=5936 RepID=A0A7S3NV70_EUPCR|mmetsp:Transcript_34687/g.34321  ORF Transcript_34687/g.34321 Transcript_34687/m.34321 type:complete len:112 (+) Transcript_34687:165-500(+)|eukprot:CAMPEP_0197011514 /NCGR_PEP_ID=MMETSP1380-20130617/58812_1 /TAXON_ID=5936 /ORGANISM="Euplotes crassus, Strain CT5" /LENGTH=111 /DNA_ID=CAMNT_0042434275 /DNA_START=151 /DNA_END=489 /DNA_ORIENTATION=-